MVVQEFTRNNLYIYENFIHNPRDFYLVINFYFRIMCT